jgi:hypothetical protein
MKPIFNVGNRVQRGIRLGLAATTLGASAIVGAAALGVGTETASATSCSGSAPVTITPATELGASITVSGCAEEGQPVQVAVFTGGPTVVGTTTAKHNTGGGGYYTPPGCKLPTVHSAGTCTGYHSYPIIVGGEWSLTLTVSGCRPIGYVSPFEVVASQPGSNPASETAPNLLPMCV